MRRLVGGLLLAATFAAQVAAAGEPTPTELEAARRLYAQAMDDERKGDWTGALAKLERVGTVRMTASTRLHMGICEEKLGHLVAALSHYQAAESQAAMDNKPEVATAAKAPIQRLQAKLPKLTVVVPPALAQSAKDLDVLLDGKPMARGLYGIEIRVDVGPHKIEATAPGYKPFAMSYEAVESAAQNVEVKLERAPTPAPTPTPTPVPVPTPSTSSSTPAPAPTLGARPEDHTLPPRDEEPKKSSALAIGTTAGTVVLAGLGVGAFLYAGSLASDAKDECRSLMPAQCDEKKGPIRTWDALALGAWAGATVGAVVATIAWVSYAKGSRSAWIGPAVDPRPGAASGGATIGGRF